MLTGIETVGVCGVGFALGRAIRAGVEAADGYRRRRALDADEQ
jgi:hypothetical protein